MTMTQAVTTESYPYTTITGLPGQWRELDPEDVIQEGDVWVEGGSAGRVLPSIGQQYKVQHARLRSIFPDSTLKIYRIIKAEETKTVEWACARPACGAKNDIGYPCWKCGGKDAKS